MMKKPDSKTGKQRAERWGRIAETLSVLTLRIKGYRILERRIKALRGSGAGEIDIVAQKGAFLVFIEVKARKTLDEAKESLGFRQRTRIWKAAELYLAQHPELSSLQPRFDAMAIAPKHWPVHIIDAWREGE